MSTYEKSHHGLTYHLNNIHIDHDPNSPTFRFAANSYPDDLDTMIGIGTWRLPRSRAAAADTLWRFWGFPANRWAGPLNSAIEADIKSCVGELVEARKEVATGFLNHWKQAEPEDFEDPSWVEEDELVQDYIETWFYLRHKELITQQIHAFVIVESALVNMVGGPKDMSSRWIALRSKLILGELEDLVPSIKAAEELKEIGNGLYRGRKFADALGAYLTAVLELAPWFPSEFLMPAWESKLTGLTQIFALAINMALCTLRIHRPHVVLSLLVPWRDHDFTTCRQAAKLWHLISIAVRQLHTIQKNTGSKYGTNLPGQYDMAIIDRNRFLRQHPDKLHDPPLGDVLSVQWFLDQLVSKKDMDRTRIRGIIGEQAFQQWMTNYSKDK